MDLEMPVMDGVSAPVESDLIATTGRADILDLSSVRSAFDHALLKPLKMDELLN